MTKPATVNAPRLQSFVERVEKLEEERKAIGADIKDVLTEAKGVGYDVKTIRWLVQERRMDANDRAERDALRDTYAHALGMAVELVEVGGLSLRQAAERTGVSKSSIHRALAVPAVSQEASQGHDPATGEITEPALETGNPVSSPDMGIPMSAEAEQEGEEIAAEIAAGVPQPDPEEVKAKFEGLLHRHVMRPAEPAIDHAAIEADSLEIPPFLDRRAGRAVA